MNLPEEFSAYSRTLLGEEFSAFEQALAASPPVSIRVNDKVALSPSDDPVPWCETGYYLAERPRFTADPLLHGGAFYVQEASSMFLFQAARQYIPTASRVLDLCAAPGGKSTLLLQTLSKDSLLVSNEVIRPRAKVLCENILKWGNSNVLVTCNSPADFGRLPAYFDAVLVDAPCSGEGMFRKDPGALSEWHPGLPTFCARRQREILSQVWPCLKRDAVLIYSTCTFNREENEENVRWICEELGASPLPVDIAACSGIVSGEYGYRFYPHKLRGEGFFLAVLRKTSGSESFRPKACRRSELKNLAQGRMLKSHADWAFFASESGIKAYPRTFLSDCFWLEEKLRCLLSGLLLGQQKGRDFLPSQQLALSKALDRSAFQALELSYADSIAFLRRESLQLPDDVPQGLVLLCYRGLPLGWGKNLGKRCNNLYPAEWRIRMDINTEEGL